MALIVLRMTEHYLDMRHSGKLSRGEVLRDQARGGAA